MVTFDGYITSIDNWMEVFACILSCKKLLSSDLVLELGIIELSWKSAYNMLNSVLSLCQHLSHSVFVWCIRVYDEWPIWVWVNTWDGIC